MLDLPGQDPDLLALPGMRAALASHAISMVYRLLNSAGVPQRRIAELTGQSQSEVSEILKGRRVMAYEVLVRICVGLGIPREAMGLGWGTYAEGDGRCRAGRGGREGVVNLLGLSGGVRRSNAPHLPDPVRFTSQQIYYGHTQPSKQLDPQLPHFPGTPG